MPRKRRKMPDLDPVTREEIAQWIEEQGNAYREILAKSKDLLETNPELMHLEKQALFYEHAIGFSKSLAYAIRVAKTRKLVGPVNPDR